MARPIIGRITLIAVYVNSFVVGAVIMGFEMLGSRYLYPYFGGGIGTWAALISTVLCALALGYLVGGVVIDRYPSPRVVAWGTASAAAYLAMVPSSSDPALSLIVSVIGDGPVGTLIASAALLLLPLSLLSMFSPVAIRLLLRSTEQSGRVAGVVYGISTVGSIFGTLFTTFELIPTLGSRSITYLYAGILAACGASLLLSPKAME